MIIIFLLACLTSFGQNAKLVNGNYISISKPKSVTIVTNTGKTFRDSKNNIYPVYITSKGKLFYTKLSKKTNKPYKLYITL
jgi:hypothetical protein